MPGRRNRSQREPHRKKEALERIRRLLDMAADQTPDGAMLYLTAIGMLEAEAPPNWRDMVAPDYPQLVPLLWQVEWERIRSLLAMATGQTPDGAKIYLRDIVTRAENGAAPPGWRDKVAIRSLSRCLIG